MSQVHVNKEKPQKLMDQDKKNKSTEQI